MPNRVIRESARTSLTLDQLSDGAERFFWRLTTVADDFGRFESDPRILLATTFPLRVGVLPIETVAAWFQELVVAGLIHPYTVDQKLFGFFKTWAKYQYCRAKESKYPDPPDARGRKQSFARDNSRRQPMARDGIRSRPSTDSLVIENEYENEKKEGARGRAPADGLPAYVVGLPFEIQDEPWWIRLLALYPGLDHEAILRDAAGYWLEHRDRYRDAKRFVRNQLARAYAKRVDPSRSRTVAEMLEADPNLFAYKWRPDDWIADGQPKPDALERERARMAALRAQQRREGGEHVGQ